MRRLLTNFFNVKVNFALGITDIDDKIIIRANDLSNLDPSLSLSAATSVVASKFETEFFEDMASLNVMRPDAVLRVTQHMDEIIAYILRIEAEGLTYTTNRGVYFDTEAFERCQYSYGKLDCCLPEMIAPDRTNSDIQTNLEETLEKRNPRDFVLWKAAKVNEPKWPSPWGDGRPGWHIECSAMTHAYFGHSIDIHSGGVDLKFPHHTNEIAQW